MRSAHLHHSAGRTLKPTTELEFSPDDLSEVLESVRRVRQRSNSWIAFHPEIAPENVRPPKSAWYGLITARGPDIPDITWAGDEIGLTHGTGPSAVERLAEAGLAIRDGWTVWQDHSKRGVSISIVGDDDNEAILRWLIAASEFLSKVPFKGHWLARTFEP